MSIEYPREEIESNFKTDPSWVNAYMCLDRGARTFKFEPLELIRLKQIEEALPPIPSTEQRAANYTNYVGFISQITGIAPDFIDTTCYDNEKVTIYPLQPDGTSIFLKPGQ